jgi:hypothetical protein
MNEDKGQSDKGATPLQTDDYAFDGSGISVHRASDQQRGTPPPSGNGADKGAPPPSGTPPTGV